MDLYFNTTDDDAYTKLVNNHTIAATNPLLKVKPSSLNMSANCWAVYDLNEFVFNRTESEEISRLQMLSNDFRTALPAQYAGTSLIEIYDYLQTIQKLDNFNTVLNRTWIHCYPTIKMGPPIAEVDFKLNCSATGEYWWRTVQTKLAPKLEVVVPLFKNALPAPYTTMSLKTLTSMSSHALNFSNSLDGRYLNRPLQSMLDDAAKSCAADACEALNFEGNPDIAGTGVSSLAMSLYCLSATHSDFYPGCCYIHISCHRVHILCVHGTLLPCNKKKNL